VTAARSRPAGCCARPRPPQVRSGHGTAPHNVITRGAPKLRLPQPRSAACESAMRQARGCVRRIGRNAQNLRAGGRGESRSAAFCAGEGSGVLCNLSRRHASAQQLVQLPAAGAYIPPLPLVLQQLQRARVRCRDAVCQTKGFERNDGARTTRLAAPPTASLAGCCFHGVPPALPRASGPSLRGDGLRQAVAATPARHAPRARSTGPMFSKSPRFIKPAASSLARTLGANGSEQTPIRKQGSEGCAGCASIVLTGV